MKIISLYSDYVTTLLHSIRYINRKKRKPFENKKIKQKEKKAKPGRKGENKRSNQKKGKFLFLFFFWPWKLGEGSGVCLGWGGIRKKGVEVRGVGWLVFVWAYNL